MGQPAKKIAKKPASRKPVAKRPAKSAAKKRVRKSKVIKLSDYLPEDDRLAALKRAAERLDGVEQTQEVLKAAQKLAVAYRGLGERLEELEANAGERLDDARERFVDLAAVQAALEMSEKLGDRATEELDEMLDRMGLMRKAVHEDDIAVLKKRHKSARKAAETKARKAAEKEVRKQLRAKA